MKVKEIVGETSAVVLMFDWIVKLSRPSYGRCVAVPVVTFTLNWAGETPASGIVGFAGSTIFARTCFVPTVGKVKDAEAMPFASVTEREIFCVASVAFASNSTV